MIDTPPDWAFGLLDQLVADESRDAEPASYTRVGRAFARYIARHEEPPVDPLLIEAREICAKVQEERGSPLHAQQLRDGDFDVHQGPMMLAAMAALRRGIELGKGGEG